MSYSTKSILILVIICLGFGITLIALAQEASVLEEVKLDEEVEAEDLEIEEPKILPDSPLYFLKNWGRGIRSFFAFNPVEKAELKSKFANEKLIETKILIEKKKNSEVIKKGIENYQEEVEEIKNVVNKIKEKAAENPEVESFLNKFTEHQILHEKILQKLEEQVSAEVFEKIKVARERHLEKFGEVMTKLEDRKEKIREKLEKNLEEIEGSKFKNFKNLEVLKALEEKAPESAKEAVKKAQENILKKLKGDLEKMSSEAQEKFKEYTDKISGDKEKQLEILENIKFESEKIPALKKKIIEAREIILEKVQEKTEKTTCPPIEKLAPGFCKDGRTIIERDENRCVVNFKCVIPSEIGISPKPTTPGQACIALWDPVCGKNGKTYSNECFAKLAKEEIAYKGVCKGAGIINKMKETEELKRILEKRNEEMLKKLETE